jgi:putative heme-binding domain-containing protein
MKSPTLLVFAMLAAPLLAADPRGDTPDTKPSTPQEQLAKFHVPPGFEVQLVAAEPEIQKPLSLNFDPAGRLWATGTVLYPWPAAKDANGKPIPNFEQGWQEMADAFRVGEAAPTPAPEGKDTLRVLSDFGPDGRARKIATFADGLNIPTGIQPLPRPADAPGDSAIVFSIPNIWRMTDTDGDGRADVREPLYESFGFTDTHGMSSNYLYWTDGWIYGCHGFRNRSEVKDRTGRVTLFESGNTYRFRPDGSAIEYYTHGQTNPYGLTVDPLGHFFSADSHSRPVMLLVRGGFYAGIGKEHDGLGFAPTITDDDHGSSSIAGIACYADDRFPAEYRGNLFNGNPVTRRINRARLEWRGSSPRAVRLEDFVTCDDPWFRPVQVQLGPDGALWIADFYTPIIGHYEVPLTHPQRDRSRGRIWRVVWRGDSPAALPDLTALDACVLQEKLADPNLVVRTLAFHELAARGWNPPAPPASAPPTVPALIRSIRETAREDVQAIYAARVALRDRLAAKGTYAAIREHLGKDAASAAIVADTSLAVPTAESANFLLTHLRRTRFEPARADEYLDHVARHLREADFPKLVGLTAKIAPAPLAKRFALAGALDTAARERKIALPEEARAWTERTLLETLRTGKDQLLDDAIVAVRDWKSEDKRELLATLVVSKAEPGPRRAAALESLVNLPGAFGIAAFALHDPSSLPLRKKAAEWLGARAAGGPPASPSEDAGEAARGTLLAALPAAPNELATMIAVQLAGTHAGCTQLLEAIERGQAPATLLRSVFVNFQLAGRDRALRDRAAALTKDLQPEDARLNQVIAARAQSFRDAKPNATHGAQIFQQHCAVCHRFRNAGGNIGPNLDGVAARGAQRLIEDILDPQRNVDPAFHQTTIETHDGQTFTGANVRDSGDALTLTDATGKDATISLASIRTRTRSKFSLMPAIFETQLAPADFHDLLGYLLHQ